MVTLDEVRAALDPEEPNYAEAVKMGTAALPYLEELVTNAEPMLASKAIYLATLIHKTNAAATVSEAARRPEAVVRVAAAAASRHLATEEAGKILSQLVEDDDVGIRKVALDSIAVGAPNPRLRETLLRTPMVDAEPQLRASYERALRHHGIESELVESPGFEGVNEGVSSAKPSMFDELLESGAGRGGGRVSQQEAPTSSGTGMGGGSVPDVGSNKNRKKSTAKRKKAAAKKTTPKKTKRKRSTAKK